MRAPTLKRTFAIMATRRTLNQANDGGFSRPGPPPLPRADQREFEELQRRVNAPASQPIIEAVSGDNIAAAAPVDDELLTMHPDLRKKPTPQFDGDTNPETGEVGGPKREPLTHGDWSYGGRATDF
ncbi:hypothetical protein OIV83_004169 [Microbotryomycetes sp. JL201]|nr:hypothetical protein OIV83_004169 [Microbotryomycetes sp. JL201]